MFFLKARVPNHLKIMLCLLVIPVNDSHVERMCSAMNTLWTNERNRMKMELVNAEMPTEPSRARHLTAVIVADSYITTLPYVEDSFHAFAVSIT